jgi:hypothetical protein
MSESERRLRAVLAEKRKTLRAIQDRMPESPTADEWAAWMQEEGLAAEEQQNALQGLEHQLYLDCGWPSDFKPL